MKKGVGILNERAVIDDRAGHTEEEATHNTTAGE